MEPKFSVDITGDIAGDVVGNVTDNACCMPAKAIPTHNASLTHDGAAEISMFSGADHETSRHISFELLLASLQMYIAMSALSLCV